MYIKEKVADKRENGGNERNTVGKEGVKKVVVLKALIRIYVKYAKNTNNVTDYRTIYLTLILLFLYILTI